MFKKETTLKALEYSKKFKIPVINHAEDNCLVNEGIINEGEISLKMGLPGNRPLVP